MIHPVVQVDRDASGSLVALGDDAGTAESVMHFEVDRLADDAAQRRAQGSRSRARWTMCAPRCATGPRCRKRPRAIAADLPQRKPALDPQGGQRGGEFLRWVADDNFTFLGYREYEVRQGQDGEVLQSVEGSGLGILAGNERSLAPRSLSSAGRAHHAACATAAMR